MEESARKNIVIRDKKTKIDLVSKKMDALKNVYNINTDSKLIKHIVDLEIQKHSIKIEEK